MASARQIRSTYRLQLHAGFGFDDAAAAAPYLAKLGVSHLYLSPILQAVPGSTHGYDVVDHTAISADLGGVDRLEHLAGVAHANGLGLVVDLVPNHMALPTPVGLNGPLWDTLQHGRASDFAHWFDVDWHVHGDRIGLAILGAPLDDAIESGDLRLERTLHGRVLRYFDQELPLDPRTTITKDLHAVISQQHYLLADWRDKDDVLNYRRFFDVDTLVAIRVELDDVFDQTHALITDLVRSDVIDGLRIDHPDGLADPQGYLERLRDATDGAWVVVEKILTSDEALPTNWPTAGTTGYDALKAIQTALAPATGEALGEIWRSTGWTTSYERTESEAKHHVVAHLLRPEVGRLSRLAHDAAREDGSELTGDDARAALEAMLEHVEVYRAYARVGEPLPDISGQRIASLAADATQQRPDLAGAIDEVAAMLAHPLTASEARRDLLVRFQQVSGPVMAKGVEDTTFYRFHRLIALNEVGGDPDTLMRPNQSALEDWALRQSHDWPAGMTTLSTHDTKRSEDVRARLLAAAEDVEGWRRVWSLVDEAAGVTQADLPTAYLIFQTLVGAWPISSDRVHAYVEKAVREAKLHTTWQVQDPGYEGRVAALVDRCLQPGPIADAIAAWVDELAPATRATTLAAKLIQLTLPGVPDVYQGTEIVSRTLVDPDNRQPVDFDGLQARVADDRPSADAGLDAEKLWVTRQALRHAGRGPYAALAASTPHALAFSVGDVVTVATRRPWQLARDGWADGAVSLPAGAWTDVLTGADHDGGPVACETLLEQLPVALLIRSAQSVGSAR